MAPRTPVRQSPRRRPDRTGQAVHLVESRGTWSLFRWASLFYLSFCALALAGAAFFQPLARLLRAWPEPFVVAFLKFVPINFLTVVAAMLIGYAGIAPLAFYLQLRGPALRSPLARSVAALLLCVLVASLLTFAAQAVARSQGWPHGE